MHNAKFYSRRNRQNSEQNRATVNKDTGVGETDASISFRLQNWQTERE
jgi:hypothetical protein